MKSKRTLVYEGREIAVVREMIFVPAGKRGGSSLCMSLAGPEGAVSFTVSLGWYLPGAIKGASPYGQGLPGDGRQHLGWECHAFDSLEISLMPTDLGYHSPKPMYEGQSKMEGKCELVEGGVCYYDGSGLNAYPVMKRLVAEGEDGVWAALTDYYVETFFGERN